MSKARSAAVRPAMMRRRRERRDGLIATARCRNVRRAAPRPRGNAGPSRAARFLAAACLLAAAMLPAGARGADIPTAPILRIETGMHGASINGLAVDEAHGQMVTVSDDKTVRIWSIADGQLAATARGPIGAGSEGALYAVALSPSGDTIAVGGY